MKAGGGVEIQLQAFITVALGGGEFSYAPTALPQGKIA